MQRKQRNGIQAEYKRSKQQQVLQPAAYPERELRRIVCWLLIVYAEIWKIYFNDCASNGSFAHCPTLGFWKTSASNPPPSSLSVRYCCGGKSRQNRTSRRPCQISPIEKELTILNFIILRFIASFFITIKSAPSGRIAHSAFRRSFFTKSSQSSQSSHILE